MTLLALMGSTVPAGTPDKVTAALSLDAVTATLPAPPTYSARQFKIVLSLGVTASNDVAGALSMDILVVLPIDL
jgi:hypothetical protein